MEKPLDLFETEKLLAQLEENKTPLIIEFKASPISCRVSVYNATITFYPMDRYYHVTSLDGPAHFHGDFESLDVIKIEKSINPKYTTISVLLVPHPHDIK